MDKQSREAPVASPYSIPTGAQEVDHVPKALASVLPSQWENPEDVTVVQIQGGITNRLYLVEAKGLPSVIVRVYGENTEVLISRESDVKNFAALTQNNFGPKLLGTFQNGRIEEFFSGAKTLEPDDMAAPKLSVMIAKELQKMHSLQIMNST